VIKRFADHIDSFAGVDHLAARMGGEEFALFLSRADMKDALKLVETIREGVPALFADCDSDLPITASFGLAVINPGESFSSAYARADVALYQAKNTGRNRTMVADALAA